MTAPERKAVAELKRLRLIGFLEGISFVVLLGIGMPLKYVYEQPAVVEISGPIHGGLFCAMGFFALTTRARCGWPLHRAALVVVMALLPFGPFLLDRSLAREQAAAAA